MFGDRQAGQDQFNDHPFVARVFRPVHGARFRLSPRPTRRARTGG
jgi:hypothetical protein